MNMKKYLKIERLKEEYEICFSVGDVITITEKIDGSNASIRYDAETDTLLAFSRNQQLNSSNTLRGFWDFVHSLNPEQFRKVLGTRYILFGEWLLRHTVRYPESAYQKYYVFDLYDTETETYCTHEQMTKAAEALGLRTVPLLYQGTFTSWDEIRKFVGITKMQASPCGEGIVIKLQKASPDRIPNMPEYLKIVAEQFSEVQIENRNRKQRSRTPKTRNHQPDASSMEQAAAIVTENRVRKLLLKMIENNQIPEHPSRCDIPLIQKFLPKACYEDCVLEEYETVKKTENFGKICAVLCMKHVKNILK
ncbi:MAG: RNA ligase family protein [Oscillospiraceae bacterium]|nr:RNA ligase family protein [Oscillospiraceae bacterium]